MAANIASLIAVNTLDCVIDPRVHGLSSFAHKALRVAVLLEALNGFVETLDRLLVVGVPCVQIAIGAGGLMKTLRRSYIGDDTMINYPSLSKSFSTCEDRMWWWGPNRR